MDKILLEGSRVKGRESRVKGRELGVESREVRGDNVFFTLTSLYWQQAQYSSGIGIVRLG